MEYEDIVPELLEKIKRDFQEHFNGSEKIAGLYAKVRDGTATYAEANEFAIEAGEVLAGTFKRNLFSAVLPDGKMYFNIADRTVRPMMEGNYDLITYVTSQVQKRLNDDAGIGIKAIVPDLNEDRIAGIVNRVSSEDFYDDVAWLLEEPIKVFSQSIVDDAIKANAEFQYGAGLSPKIVRETAGKCCEWCDKLANTYSYPDVPNGVYQRHDFCRCTVDYVAGKNRKNVHNNRTGKRKYVKDKYDGYTTSKEARIERAKQMAVTEKERKAIARQKRIDTWDNKKALNKTAEEQSKLKKTLNAIERSSESGKIKAGSSSTIAMARLLPNAEERSRVINEAISSRKPVYADDLREAYKNVKAKDGCQDVVLHGTPTYTEYEHKYILDTETLYYIVSGRRDCQNQNIRLLSCSTGKADINGKCVAQELADMLGVDVYAPIDVLNIRRDGTLTVGARTELSEEEGFKWFYPNV